MPSEVSDPAPIRLAGVDVAIDRIPVLHHLDWTVRHGERWVVVGPNGSGKTTLLRLIGAWIRPTSGTATIAGETIGRTDLRTLRGRIGYTSQSLTDLLRPTMTPHEVVLSGNHGALETWWHRYDAAAHADADRQLRQFGIDEAMAHRPLRTLSAGERQRVLLARAFAGQPALIALDEPTAGLDVGGREDLVRRLSEAATSTNAPLILVTHHLEEIPSAFHHALLIRDGRITAAGPTADILTDERLSELYGIGLDVTCVNGRWSAWARS